MYIFTFGIALVYNISTTMAVLYYLAYLRRIQWVKRPLRKFVLGFHMYLQSFIS